MVMAIKVLVSSQGVSNHLIWSFEEWFVFNLLQNLVHRFSKHCINRLSVGRPCLTNKISSWPAVTVSVQPEIPPFLRDNLILSFTHLLVLLDPLILVNTIHELA